MKNETSRREFLTAAGAAALLAGGCCCGGGSSEPGGLAGTGPEAYRRKRVAAQLWNIHEIFWNDPAMYLEELRVAGFDGVEFAGYTGKDGRGHAAREIALLLSDNGMLGAGTHVSGRENWWGDGLKRNLDFCAEAGIASYTLAWYKTDGKHKWDRFIDMMNAAAEEGLRRGIRVGYHTHFHEFEEKIGEECVWDYIFRNASPHLCQQVDTSQVIKCGVDPLALLRRYPARNWCVHIKENKPSADRPNDPTTPVDMKAITDYLNDDPGFRWYVLEEESDPTSIAMTLELAKKFMPLV